MAVPVASSLSLSCVAIRGFLQDKLKTDGADINPNVYFGSPKNSFDHYKDADDWINLFFYRFEPAGFDAGLQPGETAWLRVHCLITPVAKQIDDSLDINNDPVSEGEQDLRLIGEVMRVFHEYPQAVLGATNEQFHFQAIPQALSIESINQIWSTQGSEVAYRPSLAYEFALAPVRPRDIKAAQAPLVSSILSHAQANLKQGDLADASSLGTQLNLTDPAALKDSSFTVSRQSQGKVSVNIAVAHWAPYICFIDAENIIFPSQNVQRSALPLSLTVLIAGLAGEPVELRWKLWKSDGSDDSKVWLNDSVSSVQKSIARPPEAGQSANVIDPDQPPVFLKHDIPFPNLDSTVKQTILSAVRLREDGTEQPATQSNLLIVNVYEAL